MIAKLRHWRHRLAHMLGTTTGTIESKVWPGGTILIWFRCGTCGKISGLNPISPNTTDSHCKATGRRRMNMSQLRHIDEPGLQPHWPDQLEAAAREAMGDVPQGGCDIPLPARVEPNWVRLGEVVAGIVGGITASAIVLLALGAGVFSARVLW